TRRQKQPVNEPETVLPLPDDADATLTRLLAQWADHHRLTDDGPAAAARALAAQVAPAEPFDYEWWRTLLIPMEQALAATREVMGQIPARLPAPPASWLPGSVY